MTGSPGGVDGCGLARAAGAGARRGRVRAARDPGRCLGGTARACSAGGQHGVVSSTRRVRVVTGTPTAGWIN